MHVLRQTCESAASGIKIFSDKVSKTALVPQAQLNLPLQVALSMLQVDPAARTSATNILRRPWFTASAGRQAPIKLGLCTSGDEDALRRPREDKEVDQYALPVVAKLAVELKWLTTQIEPGDVTGFLNATSLLSVHEGNLLLHWILCSVKFPSAMRCFADSFAELPANFAAVDLKVACHRAVQR